MKATVHQYFLKFKTPGGTSRGVLREKETWYIQLIDQNRWGIGEIGLFRGLSSDDKPEFETKLYQTVDNINDGASIIALIDELKDWPSIRFGLEMAHASLASNDPYQLFTTTDFSKGEKGIPINGLIWMGSIEFMKRQIEDKLETGFRCLKLKIGANNFNDELKLLSKIRAQFDSQLLEIRLDANGAFGAHDALSKLEELSAFEIHSIEQPIKQGQEDAMKQLCERTPIPIALDEELIGVNTMTEKERLLKSIAPDYIILKPSLVGGWKSCDEWIDLAEAQNIGWWITSALESNIGLNGIAQYTASKQTTMPQGLGTGGLFTNNITSPLRINNAHLVYSNGVWENFDQWI